MFDSDGDSIKLYESPTEITVVITNPRDCDIAAIYLDDEMIGNLIDYLNKFRDKHAPRTNFLHHQDIGGEG